MTRESGFPERWIRRPLPFDRFPTGESRYVLAAFRDVEKAKRAVDALEREGCAPSEITMLIADDARRHRVRTHPEYEGLDPRAVVADPVELDRCRTTLKGAGLGALVGGPVGAVGAWGLLRTTEALGSPVTSGLALLPEAGLPGLALAALAGAGAMGGLAAIAGGVLGMRRSEYRARRLERALRRGGVLLRAKARTAGDLPRLASELSSRGGEVSLLGPA